MKYRKKPVVVEAVQFSGKWEDVPIMKDFAGNYIHEESDVDFKRSYLMIDTLEGTMKVSPKDFIIKGVNGEFYPCKPDIFQKTYEKVED